MNSSKLLVIYICLTLIYLPGYHSLFAQCNENIIINPGFEIVGPPCGPVGNLINGAFNQNCIVGWQAAWGTPSVCGFNPHSGNNMSCFGANNEGCYQNLPLCTGAIYNLSFYYLNINGNTGNLKVYLANGLINQPMGNNGNPPLVIQPGWQLLASLPVTNSTWTLGVVPAFTVNDPTNTQLLFLDMPITNLDIGIDDVVLNTTNMMPGMNVQIDINCNPTGPMYTWMASISNLPAGWTAVNFNWDFGDGTSGYGPIVNHTFPAFGIYTVCLSVVDNCGCATQACMTIDYNPCSCKCGVDTEPPIVLNAPVTPVEVSCEQDIPMAGVLMVIDSCDASPIIQFNEAISGSSCNRTITRQWIITDQCGNSSMVSQLIHLYDDTPPLFINPPLSYIEVSCLNDIPAPPAVIAVDECDIVAMVEFNESSSGQPCNMMIERIWTTTDPCGNSATISQVILMFDNTPPTVENAPLSFVEVHCLADIPPPEILIANDECNLVPEINFYETSSGPLCNQIIERTWTIEDLCGNSNIITQTIFMIDTTPPAFSPAPANIVIECPYTITDFLDWVSDYGGGVATDDCGTVFWDVQYDELPQGNCVSIPVNFIVTDLCGNSSVRTAFFNTNDSSTPAIIQPPVDLVFNCEPVNVNDILDWLSFNGG
ncbi:MAG: PKD domain-containing protein, partial [Saprospiraceae bacterium]